MTPSLATMRTLSPARERWEIRLAVAALVIATGLAYSNSLHGPFVFDDVRTIAENPSIRSFPTALFPPANGMTTSGRPLVNLTFAVNHALGGTNVEGYHVTNVLIHGLAAVTLFGLVRRTLALLGIRHSTPIALATAVLWCLHPLSTAAVTYVVQRAESLCALFILLTLYAFVRACSAATAPAHRRWLFTSVLACAAGMACKEVMVVAPLLVLLYDRTFVARSIRAALRQRPTYYVALAATWLLLAALVINAGTRGGSAGFDTEVSPLAYAITQFTAISRYLALSLWPNPLVFDHGNPTASNPIAITLSALLLGAMLLGTSVALRRGSALGYLGACFFLLLAPSSSVVPIATQTMADHRMYLALAPLLILLVLGLRTLLRDHLLIVGSAAALALSALTYSRNADFRSAETLWRDTTAKRPDNHRAHYNLGQALVATGRDSEAAASFQRAVTLVPAYAQAHHALGVTLPKLGRIDDAIRHAAEAVRLAPHMPDAHLTLGSALIAADRIPEAIAACQRALVVNPNSSDVHTQVGLLLARSGRPAEALTHFEHAARLAPESPSALANLGNVLLMLGRIDEAISRYETALRFLPEDAAVRANLNLAREARTSRR